MDSALSDSPRSHRTWQKALSAVLCGTLALVVVLIAGPSSIVKLLRDTSAQWLAWAAGVAGVGVFLRGLRLRLLLPPKTLGMTSSTLIAALAQAAALFIPARLGELALPALLSKRASWPMTSGIGTLLAARTLDLASLGIWVVVAIAFRGAAEPVLLVGAFLLFLPIFLIQPLFRVVDSLAVRLLAVRGLRGRRWTRRVRRFRTALQLVGKSPLRFTLAAAASIAMWGSVWLYSWFLIRGMAYEWPFLTALPGVCLAAVANVLPISLFANFGTLEAGWTAAFVWLGVRLEDAAASGVAVHLWALLFSALFGAAGWLGLQFLPDRSSDF
jgi:uncharacterized protein (TIRG00374 family)